VHKHVVSTTLDSAEWKSSTLIKHDIVQAITSLKQQSGQTITVHDSAALVQTLMQHGLVDRYHLLV
jgi:dihydrofolate reductase